MSNIYEALEQVSGKKENPRVTPELALQAEVIRGISLKKEMSWLHNHVELIFAGLPSKVLQFIGARRGEGVSTVVREFARIAVERHGKSVLILDALYQDQTTPVNVSGSIDVSWLDLLEQGKPFDKAFFRVGDSNLYFAPISVQASLGTKPAAGAFAVSLWEKFKERFDLIIIDSSSDENTTESVALSRNVDGVILVIEAEKTRKEAVGKLKNRILASGGHVVGAILNKRRYHVPEFIYKRYF